MDKVQFEQCQQKLRVMLCAGRENIQPSLSSPPRQCSKSSESPLKPHNQPTDIHEVVCENDENRMEADVGNAPVVEDKAIVVVKQEYADTEEGMNSANVDDGIKFISHTNYS